MLVMTFQHKSSLEQIQSTGRYYCKVDSTYRKETPRIYSYLQELICNKTGIDSRSVFGWSNLISYTSDGDGNHKPIKLFPPSFESINAALQKVPFDGKDYYIYILDVPEELVVHHDFFDFACFKADEDEGICSDLELRDFIFNSDVSLARDIQTCFPYIDKSFIKKIYEFEVITDTFGVKTLDIKFNEISWELSDNDSLRFSNSTIFGGC